MCGRVGVVVEEEDVGGGGCDVWRVAEDCGGQEAWMLILDLCRSSSHLWLHAP